MKKQSKVEDLNDVVGRARLSMKELKAEIILLKLLRRADVQENQFLSHINGELCGELISLREKLGSLNKGIQELTNGLEVAVRTYQNLEVS